MNQDQVINLIQSIGKMAGSAAAAYGVQAQNVAAAVTGLVVALVSFWFSHRSNASPPAPKV